MTIMPEHVRLMTQLVLGETIVRRGGRDKLLAVGEGLVEITGEKVPVLTDMAAAAESLDEAQAEDSRRWPRMKARMNYVGRAGTLSVDRWGPISTLVELHPRSSRRSFDTVQ